MNILSLDAANNPRSRQHYNLHQSYSDSCQRLFNAIEPSSYIRPHAHGSEQGPESLIAIRGLMALIVFDSDGIIKHVFKFGAGAHAHSPNVALGVEVSPGSWHTVISLESGSILLETKGGPFDPMKAKNAAIWAPEEQSKKSSVYLKFLQEYCRNF